MNSAKTLAKKVFSVLPELEARGSVYFFALGEREDVAQWDVIVSAAWSDENYAASVRFIAEALVPLLEPQELLALASVSIIPSSEPNITEMPTDLEKASPEEEKVIELTLMGLEVRRAFIFKARRPSEIAEIAA